MEGVLAWILLAGVFVVLMNINRKQYEGRDNGVIVQDDPFENEGGFVMAFYDGGFD